MGKRDGYTLVEVIISILLTSVLVSAVFSVALTAKSGGGKADRKLLGAQSVAAMTDALKGYVTGDSNNTMVNGPNFHYRGNHTVNTWHIHNPGIQEDHSCTIVGPPYTAAPTIGGIQDVYALSTGAHCLVCVASSAGGADSACFLPKLLRDPPYNGSIFYKVTAGANGAPQVDAGVYWTEP
jgi:type II secretory pathway pseudopilin PulG